MKRTGFLFDSFTSFENLYIAYKKAMKGCAKTEEVLKFSYFIEKELFALQKELIELTYSPAPYRYFKIFDPKERTIAVATFCDRVVHHAIINIIEPLFEPTFIYHSYATRKEKGTHKAIQQAQKFLSQNEWFLKLDISKYFDSINHNILKEQIRKKIKDAKFLSIIDKIIDNGGQEVVGLPIGNLTSQFLANVYLGAFDHYILEKCTVKNYIRYMDDFVLFDNDKTKLKLLNKHIHCYLQENLHLNIKPASVCLNSRAAGLSFLGARIYPSLLRIGSKNLKRVRSRLNQRKYEFEKNKITEKQYTDSLNSITAHIKFFDSYHLRRQMFHGQLS
ncbi:MAG: Group II intron-encoded protein LtrA [Bacteroidetes bacterium ADurb.Bin408]|nr:MAG: Group II intron-encoded protein LtrA [Bacteroidetes bacterium ADurb.Bin408]